MPLTPNQVAESQAKQSSYGCGACDCLDCYPIQYACSCCDELFANPIANNETYSCPLCGWVNNEKED